DTAAERPRPAVAASRRPPASGCDGSRAVICRPRIGGEGAARDSLVQENPCQSNFAAVPMINPPVGSWFCMQDSVWTRAVKNPISGSCDPQGLQDWPQRGREEDQRGFPDDQPGDGGSPLVNGEIRQRADPLRAVSQEAFASRSSAPLIAPRTIARWLLVIVLAASVWFFHDFLVPVLAATVIAFATWPLHLSIQSRLGVGRLFSASLLVLVALLFLVI